MKQEDKTMLLQLLQRHKELGILDQIDYEKFYLYSIITLGETAHARQNEQVSFALA